MLWLLPLIVIGGLFLPMLGYLVIAMMAFFLTLSFFKGRYWCSHLCPRGAFLDIVMSKASPNRPTPKVFRKMWFRWIIFASLMTFLVFRILQKGGSVVAIGAIFVSMCLLTTLLSIVLALVMHARGWCIICPMGTLQEKIGKLNKKRQTNARTKKNISS